MVMVNAMLSSCQHPFQLPLGVEPLLPLGVEPLLLERGTRVATSPDAGVVMESHCHISWPIITSLTFSAGQAPPIEQTLSLAVTGID